MKIAIVGPGFSGASLPLAQHLHLMGHDMDCYYLTRIGLDSIESLDFGSPLKTGQREVKIPVSNGIYRYLNKEIAIYIEPIYSLHKTFEKILIGKIPLLLNTIRTKGIIKRLLSRKYDRIILIDQFDDEQIGKSLLKANAKFVTSYHEVLESLVGEPVVRKKVLESLALNRRVILHCNKLKDDLVNLSGVEGIENRITVIRVGPFESLWQYGKGKFVNDAGDNFFLFMGRLTPYKGLSILYEAVEKICKNHDIKVLVAGSGNDPYISKMLNNDRYLIINRYINNDEMVWLVRHCRAIVCPYTAASQSGLMPLAYAYNKPIIATRVGAFPEVIVDGVNGYLAESLTSEGFADAIIRFIDDEKNYTGKPLPESINWNYIAKQVEQLLLTL